MEIMYSWICFVLWPCNIGRTRKKTKITLQGWKWEGKRDWTPQIPYCTLSPWRGMSVKFTSALFIRPHPLRELQNRPEEWSVDNVEQTELATETVGDVSWNTEHLQSLGYMYILVSSTCLYLATVTRRKYVFELQPTHTWNFVQSSYCDMSQVLFSLLSLFRKN
jgi:hypothetical protein